MCLVKNLLGDLIIDLSFLPRLIEKLEIDLPEKRIPYSSMIARDEHCRKTQIKIEKGNLIILLNVMLSVVFLTTISYLIYFKDIDYFTVLLQNF